MRWIKPRTKRPRGQWSARAGRFMALAMRPDLLNPLFAEAASLKGVGSSRPSLKVPVWMSRTNSSVTNSDCTRMASTRSGLSSGSGLR